MSKIRFAFILFVCISSFSLAQEKQMWAKSFINKEAPKLDIDTWISEKPNTEGKFVLIDFWATWCAPCRKGIKEMNNYHQMFKDDVIVIGISQENEEKVRHFKNPEIEYYSAIDTNGTLNNRYAIQGIPHVVLIDPKGIVRWEGFPMLAGHELTSNSIKNIIQEYKKHP